MPIDEVIKLFDLPQILRNNARFDVTKLTWMNGEYIRAMSRERFRELAEAFVGRGTACRAPTGDEYFQAVLALVQEKIKLLKELPDWIGYFFTDDYPIDPEAVKKSCSTPQTSERLTKLAEKFSSVAVWNAANLEAALKSLAGELGVKTGELIHPCRVAVSGKSTGPSLYHMLEVLGRDRALARLQRAAEKFRA